MATSYSYSSNNSSGGTTTISQGSPENLDKYIRERFNSMIDAYMPGWKGVLSSGTSSLQSFLSTTLPGLMKGEADTYNQLKKKGTQYMSGQLPADMFGNIRRTAAEGAQAGQLSARDLGLAKGSVDLANLGAGFLTQASSIAKGISDMSSQAQSSLNAQTEVAKTLSQISGLDPSLLVSMTDSLAQIQQQKYNTDTQAANLAAQRSMEMSQYSQTLAASKQTEALGIAMTAFGAQLNQKKAATDYTLLDPARASQYAANATSLNRQIADFTNTQLLGKLKSGISTSTLWS